MLVSKQWFELGERTKSRHPRITSIEPPFYLNSVIRNEVATDSGTIGWLTGQRHVCVLLETREQSFLSTPRCGSGPYLEGPLPPPLTSLSRPLPEHRKRARGVGGKREGEEGREGRAVKFGGRPFLPAKKYSNFWGKFLIGGVLGSDLKGSREETQ